MCYFGCLGPLKIGPGLKIIRPTAIRSSVGSNPNIMNFELFWTWQVELRTLSNPNSSTKIELQTLSNPSKKPEHWTCLARKGSNSGPNMKKLNFEPFRTQVCLLKSNYKPTQTLQKSQTSNPAQTGFDPTLNQSVYFICCWGSWVILDGTSIWVV